MQPVSQPLSTHRSAPVSPVRTRRTGGIFAPPTYLLELFAAHRCATYGLNPRLRCLRPLLLLSAHTDRPRAQKRAVGGRQRRDETRRDETRRDELDETRRDEEAGEETRAERGDETRVETGEERTREETRAERRRE